MKCDWVQDNILLYVYNELEDDARYELEQHVGRCPDCAAELKCDARVSRDRSRSSAASRRRTCWRRRACGCRKRSRRRSRAASGTALTFDPFHWLRQIRFSPALAAVIFIVGFGGGIGATYTSSCTIRPQPSAMNTQTSRIAPVEASISGIRSVAQEPGSNQVSIKYDTVSTQEAQGSLNDQRIQQLLLFAARNN